MSRILTGAIVSILAMASAGFSISAFAQGVPKGVTLFQQRCQACHSVSPDGKSMVGPNLRGVVGRAAASTPFAYSPALKSSGIKWTPAELEDFLAAPGKKVPGTRMVIAVPDKAQRGAIIDFLKTGR